MPEKLKEQKKREELMQDQKPQTSPKQCKHPQSKNRLSKRKDAKAKESESTCSVSNVAEKLGMFPSDVEQTFKELQNQGLAKCYMYKGELYAVFEGDLPELLKKVDTTKQAGTREHRVPMYS